MLGVCFRYSKNRSDAEDILQEGFIKVFQKINTFKGTGVFEGWLRRIMVNTALNHYKANLKFAYHEEITDKNNGVDFINKSDDKIFVDQSVSKEQLLGIVQNLPNGYRMVFNMYVLDGMTHKEIAEDLSISENTSKSQLSKSKKMLRKLITEKYGAKVHNII
jgi:RNA polymerase sigma-70 factor (ECF subfamily)